MADGSIVIETELSTKQFDKQIAKLKADIDLYMKVLESDAKVPVSLKMSEEERRNLEAVIEKLKNQLVGLEQQAIKTGEAGSTAGVKSGDGFEKGIKSLKRFALSLFGIRSMFSLMRRATSTYLAQNETTANKLNAIWVALGNALGPVIELIADGILKIIGYLNVFLQALGFDVDLTKNMNKSTKAVKGTTKAMKELNNEVYSFDEINKQSKETSVGGAGSGASGTNGFTMPELNQDIVKFLQDTAKWLKENWILLAGIGAIIAGFKVAKWLSGLGNIIGGGSGAGATGLLGLSNILKGLLAMEAIAIVVSIIYYGKELAELKQINEEVSKMHQQNTKDAKKVNDQNLETAKSYEKGSKEIDKYVASLTDQINSSKNVIEAKQIEKESITGLNQVWDMFGGTSKKATEIQRAQLQTIINTAGNLQELAREGKLTDEQMKVYTETMKYLNGVSNDFAELQKKDKTDLMGMKGAMDDTTYSLWDQIKALQNNETQTKTTTEKQIGWFGLLKNSVQSDMKTIDGLTASPKINADASGLQKTLNSIGKNTAIGSLLMPGLATKLATLKLAKGGIVNLPGRGVPLTNVITGEATGGAEGVIPMNNEESMDLIGQSIARHVVINLTNNTMLDSRVIAREQTKIMNNDNFLTNGRGI